MEIVKEKPLEKKQNNDHLTIKRLHPDFYTSKSRPTRHLKKRASRENLPLFTFFRSGQTPLPWKQYPSSPVGIFDSTMRCKKQMLGKKTIW